MASRTAVTDYSCTCINNPSNRNGAAKRRRDLATLFYSRLSSRRREKGCGFLEAVLQECLEIELRLQGVPFVPSVRFRAFGVFRGLIPVTAVVPALCSLRLQLLVACNLLRLLSCRFRVQPRNTRNTRKQTRNAFPFLFRMLCISVAAKEITSRDHLRSMRGRRSCFTHTG